MLFYPLDKYIAKKLKNRCMEMLIKAQNDECFLLFTGILEVLNYEYNLKLRLNDEKLHQFSIKKVQEELYKSVFYSLWEVEDCQILRVDDGINAIILNYNGKNYKVIPYLVSDEVHNTNNIGNRGFAGKLRDDLNIRKDNTCLLIIDPQPIETLNTAADSSTLTSIFRKENLKKDLMRKESPEWFQELAKAFFNDKILHTLNVLDRLIILLRIIEDEWKHDINYYIKNLRLPLFYLDSFSESNIGENYSQFCSINNEKLEPMSQNFDKDTIKDLNTIYLPDSVGENEFINILKSYSLHDSELYNYEELTYGIIKSVFTNKDNTKIKGVNIIPNNSVYCEIESNNKKKNICEAIVSKGNLQYIRLQLKGNINLSDKLFAHYYYNNFSGEALFESFVNSEAVIDLPNIDQYQTLSILINQSDVSLHKPLAYCRIILQQEADAVIIPEVEGGFNWEKDENFPTIFVENSSDIDSIGFVCIKENGEKSKISCKVTADETLDDGRVKYNVEYNGKVITKIIAKDIEEKTIKYKHLVHFIADKGLSEIDRIELFEGLYTSLKFKNQVYEYDVDESFIKLLNSIGIKDLNELLKLIIENKDEHYFILNSKDNIQFEKCVGHQSSIIHEKRKEVLSKFCQMYVNDNKCLSYKINEFHIVIKEYLELLCESAQFEHNIVKLDIIEVADKRILSPFAPINLAFYLKCWENFIDNPIEDRKVITLLNKSIDNSEAIKYIRSDDGWFIAKGSPSIFWTYYVLENVYDNFAEEKYLGSIFEAKIKQLSLVYPYMFQDSKQTLHIGVLNPGDCKFIVNGMSNYINDNYKDRVDEMPSFHITLMYTSEGKKDAYTEFESLYQKHTKSSEEESMIKKISYSKMEYQYVNQNPNRFYHLVFIKDIFKVSNNDDSMKNKEDEYLNTYFCNGLNANILTKSEYGANVVTYKTYSNYNTLQNLSQVDIMEKLLIASNSYYPQAFASNISDSKHPLRMVNVSTKDIPFTLFSKAFMVTFLDREIDIDIFNSENLSQSEKPFLVDYSNYQDKSNTMDMVKFLTITNQKEPFIEIFKNTLDHFKDQGLVVNTLMLDKLFNDLNLLNGFWVLELLKGNNNLNKTKGIIGTIAAFRYLSQMLRKDQLNWHLIIGIEQFIGVAPEYANKITDRFNDEGDNLYCDDLAVLSFPKNVSEMEKLSISLTLIEVKNSNYVDYVKKGFGQLVATEKMLKRIFVDADYRVRHIRSKELVNWLIYYRNKYSIFSTDSFKVDPTWKDEFSIDLKHLIDKVNHGMIEFIIKDGILVNINAPNQTDEFETEGNRTYIPINEGEYLSLLRNDNIDLGKYNDIFQKKWSKTVFTHIAELEKVNIDNGESKVEIKENDNNQNNEQIFEKQEQICLSITSESEKEIIHHQISIYEDLAKIQNGNQDPNPNANDFKLFIGRRITSSGELVFYDPKSEKTKLPNMNVMITGSSGKGKTQLLKSMIVQGRKKGTNFLIFDFKNDFGNQEDDGFLDTAILNYVDLQFKTLPYNPLIPPKRIYDGKEYLNIQGHIYDIAGAFKDVYRLGPQQEAALKEVLRTIYINKGFNVESKNLEYNKEMVFPVLDEAGELLKECDLKAYNRLEPVFNFGLFGQETRQRSLSDLLNDSYVLSLNNISNDDIKKAISKLIVLSAHQYLNTLPHSDKVKNVFVFDEAHRFLKEARLNTLVRECRAYGLAIWLSSQFPKDYSKEISGNLETKIIHGNDDSEENINAIREVTGFDGTNDYISNLGLFNAIVGNSHYNRAFVNTLSYPHGIVLRYILKFHSMDANTLIQGIIATRTQEILNHLKNMKLISIDNESKITLTDVGKQVAQYFS